MGSPATRTRCSTALLATAVAAWLGAAGCSCDDPERPARDAGGGRDASAMDASDPLDAAPADAATAIDAPLDAASAGDASSEVDASRADAASIDLDAGDGADAGCTPGSTRPCTLTCATGGTAMGLEVCAGGDTWTACARRPETCGNAVDDDLDGTVDEGCRVEGTCIWVRPQCQGLMTLNEWCASAGGRHLVAGRRCAVAGGGVVPLDSTYGTYPLCCCDRVSMCVPECTDDSCSGCVVWDEIQCCS